jgi:hypothetical protein
MDSEVWEVCFYQRGFLSSETTFVELEWIIEIELTLILRRGTLKMLTA